MTKHPHRLWLKDKKTWKCTLPGCAFFVHLGLAHVLEGKSGVCWNCGNVFIITEESLKMDMPECNDCIRASQGLPPADEMGDFAEQMEARAKQNKLKVVKKVEEDQIENEYPEGDDK